MKNQKFKGRDYDPQNDIDKIEINNNEIHKLSIKIKSKFEI